MVSSPEMPSPLVQRHIAESGLLSHGSQASLFGAHIRWFCVLDAARPDASYGPDAPVQASFDLSGG
jgi:hypothetical protein